ncbi:hypothetical protein NLG97_g10257 [Lecanicillium saksenae]|uniref:Uncharacterized protein n=1 Tax=Lecanicillium saksenae TaxID=468837 RepID=A0ACC1QG72_9HYPO|nr:hypothetical protein NLG97_g10257 [Lecanicillium saksenae]
MMASLPTISPERLLDILNSDVQPEAKTFERRYVMRKGYAVKSELKEDQFIVHPNGDVIKPFWPRERLHNEFATLRFLQEHTKITVPQHWLFIHDSVLHLATERILDAVPVYELPESKVDAATEAVAEQVQEHILPQLRAITRATIGSIVPDIAVFPPSRLYCYDHRPWESIRSEPDTPFVLCHNDLGPQNIFADPDTYEIKYIIDWEFAGFFPERFEIPLWTIKSREERAAMCEETRARDLAPWGLTVEEINTSTR